MLSLRLPLRLGVLNGTDLQTFNAAAARFVAVILVLMCFYYASSLFWRVFYAEGFSLAVSAGSDGPVLKVANVHGKWSWFADTAVSKRKAAPPSRLKANLIGVISRGKKIGKGIAIIKYKGKEKIYRVGDEIASAITLKEVAAAYVMLQRDDRTEILEIEKSKKVIGGKGASGGRAAPSVLTELPGTVASAKEFMKLLRKEPLQLLNLFSFDRVKNGRQTGFRMSAKNEDSQMMLESMGLKDGDVLLSVNGAPTSQVPSNPRLWKALNKADKIKLKVLRDGAQTEISIQK